MGIMQSLLYGFIGLIAGYLSGWVSHYYINDMIGNPSWLSHLN